MRFLSLTRAVDCTAAAYSLQTQAGSPAGQAAQSAVQRSPPSVTYMMGYYSFNRPRRDGRLSWPCWLTDSGRRTHKVVKQPSISLAQDKESLPARTDVLTTMLRHQRVQVFRFPLSFGFTPVHVLTFLDRGIFYSCDWTNV